MKLALPLIVAALAAGFVAALAVAAVRHAARAAIARRRGRISLAALIAEMAVGL